jgi:hypothetical protein
MAACTHTSGRLIAPTAPFGENWNLTADSRQRTTSFKLRAALVINRITDWMTASNYTTVELNCHGCCHCSLSPGPSRASYTQFIPLQPSALRPISILSSYLLLSSIPLRLPSQTFSGFYCSFYAIKSLAKFNHCDNAWRLKLCLFSVSSLARTATALSALLAPVRSVTNSVRTSD